MVDNVFQWGFRRVRDIGDSEDSKRVARDHPYLHRASRTGKVLLSFLGEIGDSFYSKYAELKNPKDK